MIRIKFLRHASLMLLFGIFTLSNPAAAIPQHDAVPGGVAIVALPGNPDTAPVVTYNDNRVLVRNHNNNWQALVGIPLEAQPGVHRLVVRHATREFVHEFSVSDKHYDTTHITIPNERMVSPSNEDLLRHQHERVLMNQALQTWSEIPEVDTVFIKPVQGRFSSPFGLRRIFNNQERIRRHTGLDIAAPVGTPIITPNGGKVIRTGDYFFTGNTVFIDHGQGLISMYCHLDSIKVREGDIVQRGDLLGEVGMTGRVSGPHLHWTIYLNRIRVDPMLFMALAE